MQPTPWDSKEAITRTKFSNTMTKRIHIYQDVTQKHREIQLSDSISDHWNTIAKEFSELAPSSSTLMLASMDTWRWQLTVISCYPTEWCKYKLNLLVTELALRVYHHLFPHLLIADGLFKLSALNPISIRLKSYTDGILKCYSTISL